MELLDNVLREISEAKWEFYVYVLYKPDGTPFYVGKGTVKNKGLVNQRIREHEVSAKSTIPFKQRRRCNRLKIQTIRKIWQQGHQVLYAIDSWHQLEECALGREVALIAMIGRRMEKEGPLTNLRSGGEASSDMTIDVKCRISNSLKKY